MEQHTLVTRADDVHATQQSAVTLEVALSPQPDGLDDVHPDINPEGAQQAEPPLLRTEEGFLGVEVERCGEEGLKLLSAELFMQNPIKRNSRP